MEAKSQGYETEEEILMYVIILYTICGTMCLILNLNRFVYNKIVEKASVTNAAFDSIAASRQIASKDSHQIMFSVMKSIFEAPKIHHNSVSSSSFSNLPLHLQPLKISFRLDTINSVIPKIFSS